MHTHLCEKGRTAVAKGVVEEPHGSQRHKSPAWAQQPRHEGADEFVVRQVQISDYVEFYSQCRQSAGAWKLFIKQAKASPPQTRPMLSWQGQVRRASVSHNSATGIVAPVW
jgi:hypothetical protein